MISAVQDEKIYEFGDFRLIPGEELLLHKGEPIELNPKALAVLSLLVERHGHLVLKSEITELIWEDAFVEEGSISKSVWFIRNALGDTTREKFIHGRQTRIPVCVSRFDLERPHGIPFRRSDPIDRIQAAWSARKQIRNAGRDIAKIRLR